MPPIDIRRHGRDILIPYTTLTRLAGYTLTSRHLDRVARALPHSSLPDTLATVLGALLTPAEFEQVHHDLTNPFAGHTPPHIPAPCEGRDATVLAELHALQVEYEAEPFLTADSDTGTDRDLAYFDRIIEILDLADPDTPPAPTPTYRPDQLKLYRALVTLARQHAHPLDATIYTQIHTLAALLTTDTEPTPHDKTTAAAECGCPTGTRHLITGIWVPHDRGCPHAAPHTWIWALAGVPRTGILTRYAEEWNRLRRNGPDATADLSTELRTWDGHTTTVTITEDDTDPHWTEFLFHADGEATSVRTRRIAFEHTDHDEDPE
ncbi:hypothetical protein [Nocardia carnea]|uniref:hypothetical protein n=1 Tax=Nocardia carnea TaxID=37328 RepID=UPI002457B558|nr:hypothetical protein [Nocardia carnea]